MFIHITIIITIIYPAVHFQEVQPYVVIVTLARHATVPQAASVGTTTSADSGVNTLCRNVGFRDGIHVACNQH